MVLDGKLLLLHAGAGSNKLETARSLDLLGLAASYKFSERMKVEAVTLLEQLEAWVDKQALSLDVAQNAERISQSFDSLLKVLDSLYQVSHSQWQAVTNQRQQAAACSFTYAPSPASSSSGARQVTTFLQCVATWFVSIRFTFCKTPAGHIVFMLQIKVKKADNDLLIEQLHEVFRVLAADKMPVIKLDKRLDDVKHKWDEVKKLQPQVKSNVEPVQVS